MDLLVVTLILCSFFTFCVSFPPNTESVPNSKSHAYITRLGIYGAASIYLEHKKQVSGHFATDYDRIKEYFRLDNDGLKRFERAIDKIVESNNKVQLERAGEAKISFNGDQIKEGKYYTKLAHHCFGKSHFELVSLRGKIETEAKKNSSEIKAIRGLIGQYLYTLQSFYSNTNWIEMRGVSIYFDLGLKSAELIDIASPFENTCKNSYSGQNLKHSGHCPKNIIAVNKLTSGYKSRQDIKKPKSSQSDQGKCSHGGPSDLTINTTANCGINKETSDSISSPHYHFHEDAAIAAIMATEHFITNGDVSLINILNEKLFEAVFGLRKKTSKSLAFVIDVTGSMGDDIDIVKNVTIDIVEHPVYEPAYYVLTTFSDPANLTTGYETEMSSNMIQKISSLTVRGGGDCPEYALSGIVKGISLSQNDSLLFVFTDADAKDYIREPEVKNLSATKRIKIDILRRRGCSTRKRRDVKLSRDKKLRYKRQSGFDSVFHRIANATGGNVHDVSSGNYSEVLETLLQASFPNTSEGLALNLVHINYISRPENGSSLMEFYIDENVTHLQIHLTGVQSIIHVNLVYPNGDLVNFTSSNNTWWTSDLNTIDIRIFPTFSGQWNIIPKVSNEVNANISGQGSLDFTYKIMDKGADGYLYDVNGNPIAGNSYIIVITLIGDTDHVSLLSMILIDSSGVELSTNTLVKLSSFDDTRYKANITMLSESFFLKIQGISLDGNTFTRIKWSEVLPVRVMLTLVPVYGELLINQESVLYYKIRNVGDYVETFFANIEDDNGYLIPPTFRNYTIDPNTTIKDNFTVLPTIGASGLISYTIKIGLSESNEILQEITKYVYVTNVQHPTCKIISVDGNCPVAEVTSSNCTFYKWSAMTETTYSSVALSSVTLSNTDSNTHLYTGNTSSIYGPLSTNVSGTCCIDIVDLHVLDTEGYLATCRLNFRDNEQVATFVTFVSDVKNETTKGNDSDNSNLVAVAVGISAGILLIIIMIVFRLIMNHFGSSAKVKDPSVFYSTPKAMDTVTSVKFNPKILDQAD